jgi:hypothetical protein
MRPRYPGGPLETWCTSGIGGVVRPFAKIELECFPSAASKEPPHTEDCEVDPAPPQVVGLLSEDEQYDLLNHLLDGSVDSVFGTAIYRERGWWVKSGTGTRSLGTIRPRFLGGIDYIRKTDGSGYSYYLIFTDEANNEYRLSASDLAFRAFLDELCNQVGGRESSAASRLLRLLHGREMFLRIGLARGWSEFPGTVPGSV